MAARGRSRWPRLTCLTLWQNCYKWCCL